MHSNPTPQTLSWGDELSPNSLLVLWGGLLEWLFPGLLQSRDTEGIGRSQFSLHRPGHPWLRIIINGFTARITVPVRHWAQVIINQHSRHTHTRPHTRTHMHMHTHIHTHTHRHTHTNTHTHARTHACMHTHTHTHMHTCMHSHMHTCTHAHTHTHTQTHTHPCYPYNSNGLPAYLECMLEEETAEKERDCLHPKGLTCPYPITRHHGPDWDKYCVKCMLANRKDWLSFHPPPNLPLTRLPTPHLPAWLTPCSNRWDEHHINNQLQPPSPKSFGRHTTPGQCTWLCIPTDCHKAQADTLAVMQGNLTATQLD